MLTTLNHPSAVTVSSLMAAYDEQVSMAVREQFERLAETTWVEFPSMGADAQPKARRGWSPLTRIVLAHLAYIAGLALFVSAERMGLLPVFFVPAYAVMAPLCYFAARAETNAETALRGTLAPQALVDAWTSLEQAPARLKVLGASEDVLAEVEQNVHEGEVLMRDLRDYFTRNGNDSMPQSMGLLFTLDAQAQVIIGMVTERERALRVRDDHGLRRAVEFLAGDLAALHSQADTLHRPLIDDNEVPA